ncbi:MAG: sugar nucleotide-binding protein [Pleurocapsa minor GSE-CHR-MK-17-07R]|jgi:nucleoside-diphosphate-sugar epimerase|nr:sugar nucleotide-binding protein [Pleurocapsa minor GSE-CHR-MK 17-07R]
MPTALLGYTGFVGTTLRAQTSFDALYNSQNIADIRGQEYDLIVCAAAPAAKWKANQDPDGDRANLLGLMEHLRHARAGQFVLISTIDVFRMPPAVDESTPITPDRLDAYGRNRYELEQFALAQFPNVYVLRLPGLFGAGLKKNFLFDMIHRGASEWTHADSVFQFYNMANLWSDVQRVLRADPAMRLIHIATEPVRAGDVARQVFAVDYTHQTANPPVSYDMQTLHAGLWGKSGRYIASADEIYAQIRAFAQAEKPA